MNFIFPQRRNKITPEQEKQDEQEKQTAGREIGKKPRGKPFTSGNDSRRNLTGRPKLGATLAARYRDALAEAESEARGGDYTKLDAMIDVLIDKALEGDQRAIEYLQERGFGKVPDKLEIGKEEKEDAPKLNIGALSKDELWYFQYLCEKANPDTSAFAHEPVEFSFLAGSKPHRITLTRVEISQEEYSQASKLNQASVNRRLVAGKPTDKADIIEATETTEAN